MLKRFISEDPIRLVGGINLYLYVRGNPISRRDPLGLLQRDIDTAWRMFGERYSDLKRTDSPPTPDLPTDDHGWYDPYIDEIRLHPDYLKPLSDTEARDLAGTVIHELLHRNYPSRGHDWIDPETERRTRQIIDEYNKRRKLSCP